MKKRVKIFLFASISVVAIIVGASAFKKSDAKDTLQSNMYFQYGSSSYGETNFEDSTNWSYLQGGNPISDPCDPGDHTCVLEVSSSDLASYSGTPIAKLRQFLIAQTPTATGATTYVNGPARKHSKE
jgi:hypothetical protein